MRDEKRSVMIAQSVDAGSMPDACRVERAHCLISNATVELIEQ